MRRGRSGCSRRCARRAHRFGGSHAQRDLIDQTLLAACALPHGDRALGRALLNERLLARGATPQVEHWRARLVAYWCSMRWLVILLVMLTCAVSAGPAHAAEPATAVNAPAEPGSDAVVRLYNRRIVELRAALGDESPPQRAARARAAIASAAEGNGLVSRTSVGVAVRFDIDGAPVFFLLPEDLGHDTPNALFEAGVQKVRGRLEQALAEAREMRDPRRLARGAVHAIWPWPTPTCRARTAKPSRACRCMAGLMLSLGASSVVGQALSGLSLMYSRSLRVGEYVKIGDTEGTVTGLGMFTTKVHTGLGEEVSLPNSVIFSQPMRNFSRLVEDGQFMLHTAVTIGYSTPWRQVHAMLLEAAARTPGRGRGAQHRTWCRRRCRTSMSSTACARKATSSAPRRRAEAHQPAARPHPGRVQRKRRADHVAALGRRRALGEFWG